MEESSGNFTGLSCSKCQKIRKGSATYLDSGRNSNETSTADAGFMSNVGILKIKTMLAVLFELDMHTYALAVALGSSTESRTIRKIPEAHSQ
jgi:hypothetical protein